MSGFDLAGCGFCGAGKRTLFVTEEFTFQQVIRNRRAVDSDKPFFAPWRSRMNSTRNQFLASTAFSKHQYGHIAARDFFNRTADSQDFGIPRNQPCQDIRLMHELQPVVLLLKIIKAIRAFNRQPEHIDFEWLGEKIIRPEPHSPQSI